MLGHAPSPSMLSGALGAASGAIGKATGSSDKKVAPAPDGPGDSPEKSVESPEKGSGLISGAASSACSVINKAAGTVGDATSKVVDTACAAAPVTTAAIGGAKNMADAALDGAAQKVTDMASMSKERMKEMSGRLRQHLEAWLKKKMQAVIEKVVDKLPGLAKNGLEDPEMPRCISRGKDRLIDNVWPDIREEILWEVAVLIDSVKEPDEADMSKGVDCFRAFWRYHLMPYDKGFWAKIRDPVFVLFLLFSLIPVYGVSQLVFLFMFLIMDKSDEFQLINFILGFKGTQFISMGVLRCITGYAMFMMCVPAKASDHGGHDCKDNGPGNRGAMMITSAGLLFQVILVWIAFLLIRCSVEKGRTQLKGHIGHETQGSATKAGGYIRYFLYYDLAFFFIALFIPVWAVITRPGKTLHDDWVVAQSVYTAQIIYGLLSVPFFMFTLPGLQRILTHAMPTAYDRSGRCRKLIKPKKPEEPKRPADGELVSDEDAEGMLTKMRDMILTGK